MQQPVVEDYWNPSEESLNGYLVKLEYWREWYQDLTVAKQIVESMRNVPKEFLTRKNINVAHLISLVGEDEAFSMLGLKVMQPELC
jgi:hypothetical protein